MAHGISLKNKLEKNIRERDRLVYEKSVLKGTYTRAKGMDVTAYNVYFDKDGKFLGGGNRHERRKAAKLSRSIL